MKVYDKQECISYFKRKYNYMKYEDIELLYDMALDVFINARYPFKDDIDDTLVETEIKKHPTWCLRCMQEMIDRMGVSNVIGYSENGVSVTFDKTGISQSLLDELVAVADLS